MPPKTIELSKIHTASYTPIQAYFPVPEKTPDQESRQRIISVDVDLDITSKSGNQYENLKLLQGIYANLRDMSHGIIPFDPNLITSNFQHFGDFQFGKTTFLPIEFVSKDTFGLDVDSSIFGINEKGHIVRRVIVKRVFPHHRNYEMVTYPYNNTTDRLITEYNSTGKEFLGTVRRVGSTNLERQSSTWQFFAPSDKIRPSKTGGWSFINGEYRSDELYLFF